MADRFAERSMIRAQQLGALQALLAEMLPGNVFYRRKLEADGIAPRVESLADFSQRFPFTLKSELSADQAANPPYGTNLTYELTAYTRFHQTSGTTGAPLRWLDTPASWNGLVESWTEVLRAAGVTRGDRVLFAFSFGPFIGFWMAFESAESLGCLCLAGGSFSSTARLQLMLDNEVTILCCTPTYALHLGQVAARQGIDARRFRVRRIVVAGEPGGSIPSTRQRIESLWPSAKVFDHHGMTEVGPVTYECPHQPGRLHVIERAYLAEILEPNRNRAVEPGAQGELVLTTLHRHGSPLLRYRTGDLVRASTEPVCSCGRQELALEGGILGRVDDMVIVRGVNLYPSSVDAIVRACGGIDEYQVQVRTIDSLSEVRLLIEPLPDAGDPSTVAHRLQHALSDAFALRIPVSVAAPNSLPRFEMKARRWLRQGEA